MKKIIDLSRPFDVVFLPSKGLYYKNKKSVLKVRYLCSHEETVLTNPYLVETGEAIKMVLDNCIVDEDIGAEDLVLGDIQALSMFLRSTAYGDKISLQMECPSCHKQLEPEVFISKFKMKDIQVPPDEEGLVHFEQDNFLIKIKIPSLKEELENKQIINKNSNLEKTASVIAEINGRTEPESIKKILKTMKPITYRLLKEFIQNNTPGADTILNITCEFCNHEFKSDFNLGYDFLALPESYHQNILEELFLLEHYGENISLEKAEVLPVNRRRFFINRIAEELDKKRKAEESAARQAQSKAKSRRK